MLLRRTWESGQLEQIEMKNTFFCAVGKVCTGLPGACIILQMILVVVLASVLGYVFVTQELLG